MMRVKAWLANSNLARVFWPLTCFPIYYMFVIILTIETSSAVGQRKEVWSSCPGFDPRRELLAFSPLFSPDPAHLTFWGSSRALWSHPLDPSPARSNASIRRSTMSPQKMVSLDQAPDSGPSFWVSEVQHTPPVCFITPGPNLSLFFLILFYWLFLIIFTTKIIFLIIKSENH